MGLTQVALAKKIKSSQSRVAKMEAGDPSVSIDLLVRSLIALGETPTNLRKTL
jgi:transcriptional regulator with XRE-family HTH domain